jgi:hypothetical protein
MPEPDTTSTREWEATLDRLEVQLDRAERIGSTGEEKDVELALPDSLTTIPRYLLARAHTLIERHQRLVSVPRDRTTDTFTLHDRVGHLVSGPREPLSFEVFGPLVGEATSN